jgi:thiamine-phosphate pyrophosphorylase
VYPTTLKVMPWKPQGLARVGHWKRCIGALPLVAIGGITLARLPEVLTAGADAAAVVSDIVTATDPEAQTQRWLAAAAA